MGYRSVCVAFPVHAQLLVCGLGLHLARFCAPKGSALSTTTCTTGMVSHRLTYSRRYGSPLYRAPRTEDGQLVPAGLLTRGSGALSGLPDGLNSEAFSGICGANLPLTVAGAVSALALDAPHRVPVFTVRTTCTNGTVTQTIEESCEALSMGVPPAHLIAVPVAKRCFNVRGCRTTLPPPLRHETRRSVESPTPKCVETILPPRSGRSSQPIFGRRPGVFPTSATHI